MRYLAFVLLISVALVAECEPASLAEPVGLFPSSELVEQETTESSGHLLVLGHLKRSTTNCSPKNSFWYRAGKLRQPGICLKRAGQNRSRNISNPSLSSLRTFSSNVRVAPVAVAVTGRTSFLSARYSTGPSSTNTT